MEKKYMPTLKESLVIIIFGSIGVLGPTFMPEPYKSLLQYLLVLLSAFVFFYLYRRSAIKSAHKLDKIHTDVSQQKRMLHTQKVMLELSNSMTKVESIDELLDTILKKAIEVMPEAEYGSILVMNSQGKLGFKAISGFSKDLFDVTLDPNESYQWRATNGNFVGPIIIEDLLDYTEDFMSPDNYNTLKRMDALSLKSSLSAPLIIDGEFYGSINIDNVENHIFGEEHLELMAYFANQATIAIMNHKMYEKMIYLSKYDGLTKVLNRRYFQETLEDMLTKSLRDKEIVTLVLMDLNKFKAVNDTYGHLSGDKLLVAFTHQFTTLIRQSDLIARYGGDEFVAVFFNSDLLQTQTKMIQIHESIQSTPIELVQEGVALPCQFSYGLAEFPKEGASIKALVHLADQRMYQSKSSTDHE